MNDKAQPRKPKQAPSPPEGEALVQAALANKGLIEATEEAYLRAERGEPALFFRGKYFLRHLT